MSQPTDDDYVADIARIDYVLAHLLIALATIFVVAMVHASWPL